MKTNYVLVDFENVQPGNLDFLLVGLFKIKVFVGQNQKISVDVAKALQAFGSDAEYIQIVGTGNNSLDFHIAYYIGRLAAESTDVHFYIVSKDTGFDPLIQHLKHQKIDCQRISSIADVQPAKQAPAAFPAKMEPNKKASAPPSKKAFDALSIAQQIAAVIARLKKGTKPGTEKTLRSFIKASFTKPPSSEQIGAIIKEMQAQKIITMSEDRILYGLSS